MTIEQNIIRKIAIYAQEATNWTKPDTWRALARSSTLEWKLKLEQHRADLER